MFTRPRGSRKETFFCVSTENDARTSARVLLFGAVGPLSEATTPFGTGAGGDGCAKAGAFFALKSSAHDFGGAGFAGGSVSVVSSALDFSSGATAGGSSTFGASCDLVVERGDLTDFCVVEAAVEGFVGLMGMSGTTGLVVLRACFGAGGEV